MPALREVRDPRDRLWSIFEVHPRLTPTQSAEAAGQSWLCLRTDVERRRILPIPDGWNELTDSALLHLVDEAGPTGRRKRVARVESD